MNKARILEYHPPNIICNLKKFALFDQAISVLDDTEGNFLDEDIDDDFNYSFDYSGNSTRDYLLNRRPAPEVTPLQHRYQTRFKEMLQSIDDLAAAEHISAYASTTYYHQDRIKDLFEPRTIAVNRKSIFLDSSYFELFKELLNFVTKIISFENKLATKQPQNLIPKWVLDEAGALQKIAIKKLQLILRQLKSISEDWKLIKANIIAWLSREKDPDKIKAYKNLRYILELDRNIN